VTPGELPRRLRYIEPRSQQIGCGIDPGCVLRCARSPTERHDT